MSAYVVVQVTIENAEAYERYKGMVPPTLAPYGGKFVSRGGRVETLEGSWTPPRFVILRFPSVEKARAWWASPEYADAKALRQASARTEMILAEGVPEGPGAAAAD